MLASQALSKARPVESPRKLMMQSKFAFDDDDSEEEECDDECQEEKCKEEEVCDLLGMDAFAGDFQQMAEIRKEQKLAFKVIVSQFLHSTGVGCDERVCRDTLLQRAIKIRTQGSFDAY